MKIARTCERRSHRWIFLNYECTANFMTLCTGGLHTGKLFPSHLLLPRFRLFRHQVFFARFTLLFSLSISFYRRCSVTFFCLFPSSFESSIYGIIIIACYFRWIVRNANKMIHRNKTNSCTKKPCRNEMEILCVNASSAKCNACVCVCVYSAHVREG